MKPRREITVLANLKMKAMEIRFLEEREDGKIYMATPVLEWSELEDGAKSLPALYLPLDEIKGLGPNGLEYVSGNKPEVTQ